MIIVFLINLGILLFTSSPTVCTGDSGELITSSYVLGISHPPGYPLYVLLGKIFTILIPYGNIAYRVNCMSVFFGALTCGIMYLLMKHLTSSSADPLSHNPTIAQSHDSAISQSHNPAFPLSRFPAFLSAFFLAFSNIFWSQCVQTKGGIYTLNAFFVILIIYLLLVNRYSLLISFLFGLGLCNHHTLVLLFPGMLYLILQSPKYPVLSGANSVQNKPLRHWTSPALPRGRDIGHWTLFFLLGFSLYLYLFIRSRQNPIANWDNPGKFINFLRVVFRIGYGGVMHIEEKGGYLFRPLPLLMQQLWEYIKNIVDSFTVFGSILGITGFIYNYKKEKKYFWFLFLIFFFSGPIFMFLANKPVDDSTRDLLEPFHIPSVIIFAIWIGMGVKYIVDKTTWVYHKAVCTFVAYIFITGFLVFQFSANFQRNNLRYNFFPFDLGKNILKTVSNNSLLFLDKADESVFILAYQKIVEKRRPTVDVFDCNASVFPNIYGDRYYWIKGSERRMVRLPIERKMILDSGKSTYYLAENPDYFSDMKFYNAGLLYSLNKEMPQHDFSYIYALRGKYSRFRDAILAYFYYLTLSKYYIETNQKNTAILMFKNAIEIFPNYEDAHYSLAALYWDMKNWQGVVEEFEKVLQINPERADVKNYLEIAKKRL
ncbi:MAG: DUF2723 domain-containing protein [Elusimicrobia bacterium]|nr:DUF2723 domain-containing protein [Elusimicrobiota bacterium]